MLNQNTYALAIVFAVLAYASYQFVKNLRAKDSSACGGCTGCSLKDHAKGCHSEMKGSGEKQQTGYKPHVANHKLQASSYRMQEPLLRNRVQN